MTDAPVPPGWYPHPGGDGALRWWDGRQWREPEPPVVQEPLPEGVTTNTWAFWIVALLPLLGVAQNAVALATGLPASALRPVASPPVSGLSPDVHVRAFALAPTPEYTVFTLVSYLVSLVLIVASGLLALRDQRMLRERGIVRPFPWGWGFLHPVYVVGRSVIVRRRVHGSLAPLWLWIVLLAVSLVLSAVLVISTFASAFSSIGSSVS